MYTTHGIDAIATITELRAQTSQLVEQAQQQGHSILIQKNNEPYAVLISHALYDELLSKAGKGSRKRKGA
jgi:prevent-host-death family protein